LFSEGQHNATLETNKEITDEQKKVLKKCLSALHTKEPQNQFDTILKNARAGNPKQ